MTDTLSDWRFTTVCPTCLTKRGYPGWFAAGLVATAGGIAMHQRPSSAPSSI